jgi:hypothetical protein
MGVQTLFTMKSKVVNQPSVVSEQGLILFKVLTKQFVKEGAFYKFPPLFCAFGSTQNAGNGFSFDFFRAVPQ